MSIRDVTDGCLLVYGSGVTARYCLYSHLYIPNVKHIDNGGSLQSVSKGRLQWQARGQNKYNQQIWF